MTDNLQQTPLWNKLHIDVMLLFFYYATAGVQRPSSVER